MLTVSCRRVLPVIERERRVRRGQQACGRYPAHVDSRHPSPSRLRRRHSTADRNKPQPLLETCIDSQSALQTPLLRSRTRQHSKDHKTECQHDYYDYDRNTFADPVVTITLYVFSLLVHDPILIFCICIVRIPASRGELPNSIEEEPTSFVHNLNFLVQTGLLRLWI